MVEKNVNIIHLIKKIMKNKIAGILHARLLIAAILVLLLSSCGSSKHSQKTTGWISWLIEFKPGTSNRKMNKGIDHLEAAITKEYPFDSFKFHTSFISGKSSVVFQADHLGNRHSVSQDAEHSTGAYSSKPVPGSSPKKPGTDFLRQNLPSSAVHVSQYNGNSRGEVMY
jgi:hypothetical protein